MPREEIPLHVEINNDLVPRLKHVEIDLPACFRVVDTINVRKCSSSGRIVVSGIKKSRHRDYDYFGIVIATREPFDELAREIPIPVTFRYLDGTAETGYARARIFRPLLDLEVPGSVTLAGGSDGICLPIRLKYSGFGEVTLRVECRIGGAVVSAGTSALDEAFLRLIGESMAFDGGRPADEVITNGDYAEPIAKAMGEFLSDAGIQRLLAEGRLDDEHAGMLRRMSEEEKRNVAGVFREAMKSHLARFTSESFSRYLSRNCRLESTTTVLAQIRPPATKMDVRLRYKDALGNEYDPVERTVELIDKRESPGGAAVEIPLKVVGIDESAAYWNAEDMVIGS